MKTTPSLLQRPGGWHLLLLALLLPAWAGGQHPASRSVALHTVRPPAGAAPTAAAPEASPAPVALSTWAVGRTPQGALLTWDAVGKAAGRFDVERSTDGVAFRAVGTVPVRTAGPGYRFLDPAPGAEAVYYRLRFPGGFSEVLPLPAADWELTPNPAAEWLSCGPASGDYCIRDAAKRLVLSGHLGPGQRIDLRRLRNGSYTLELRAGSQRTTRSFVKYTP
ncbi:hypothetical protein EJV47_17360 [Hymenobacter gummosus]|uniref:T9SS type A sorting domain-containing protein n=1 Tax=Hymenobacter gummosus TaxID=1776032 RepID=A0A3S0K3X0_9BACT|nr:hypothetical protein [Hymenobacter gummosus]RTQ48198.1 hypothetical protein EJV47_17360 [Hymenobacter gummosus]